MILTSMGLVLVALVLLLLGVVGFGEEPLYFAYASIGVSLVAAVFLVTGVLRSRPARMPQLVNHPHLPSWSGARGPSPAAAGPLPPPDPRGDAPGAGAAPGDDAEHERFVQVLGGLGLDSARTERLRGRFVTVERLTAATIEELEQVPGISEPLARAIHHRVRATD